MSLDGLNLNNINVDAKTGSVSFSGLISDINSRAAIDNIIAARRIPVDRIETNITRNTNRIGALDSLRSLVLNLQEKSRLLHGAISLDNAKDVFETKQAFAASSRSDGATPTAAQSLLGVNVSNAAQTGKHKVEILQRAQSQSVASSSTFTSGAGIGIVGAFSLGNSNSEDLNAKRIEILATDTIADIRDKINTANRGNDATGVSASLIFVTPTEATLTLTSDDGNSPILLNDPGGVLNALTVTDPAANATGGFLATAVSAVDNALATAGATAAGIAGALNGLPQSGNRAADTAIAAAAAAAARETDETAAAAAARKQLFLQSTTGIFRNETFAAQDARLKIDGLGNPNAGAVIGNLANGNTVIGRNGGIEIVNLNSGRRIARSFRALGPDVDANELIREIDGQRIGRNTTISAQLQPAAGGGMDLRITASGPAGNSVPIQVKFNNFNFAPNIAPPSASLSIARDENTIDDIFEGITLDLLRAEPGTTVELDIQRNLPEVQEAIVEFVGAYNDVRSFLNQQRQIDPETGEPVAEAALFGASVLSQIESQLNLILADPAAGVPNDSFRVLAQAGIDFVDNSTLDDALKKNTLEIDETKLADVLLNDFDNVRDLFAFRFTSSDARFRLLDFSGETDLVGGERISIARDGRGSITSATIDGVSATINGRILRFDDGPAAGLRLRYNGDLSVAGVVTSDLSNSRGVGANFFFDLNNIVGERYGTIPTETASLESINELNRTRANEQLERLERERQRLTVRFNALEASLARLEAIRQQVESTFAGLENGNN